MKKAITAKSGVKPMEVSATVAATPAVKPESRKRGNGPAAFVWVDEDGEEINRAIPTYDLRIKPRVGDTVDLSLQELDDKVALALVGYAVKEIVNTFLRNHADESGNNIGELIAEKWKEIKSGTPFQRSAPKRPGSRFDATLYVDAMRKYYKAIGKTISDDEATAFGERLSTLDAKARLAKLAELNGKIAFKQALLEVKIERNKSEARKAVKGGEDLLSIV
jgi:hypothetical protein